MESYVIVNHAFHSAIEQGVFEKMKLSSPLVLSLNLKSAYHRHTSS